MRWQEFLRDHHRPHLLEMKLEGALLPKLFGARAKLERLASSLGAVGNYAFKVEARVVYAAFEEEADAERFANVFRPEQTTRDSEWASKTFARMDDATYQRMERVLKSGD
jgi:hypothetical protein